MSYNEDGYIEDWTDADETEHVAKEVDENVDTQGDIEIYRRRPPQPPKGMWISNAFIERISNERDTVFATVVYRETPRGREQTVRLVVSRQTKITDMNGRRLRPSDLEVGMVIDAFISTAMTRSIPPQAEAFEIVVIGRRAMIEESVGRIVQVDAQNNFMIVATSDHNFNIIRFNIGPETVILDLFGRRVRLGDLFPGLRVRVEHATFMTASIPPQTIAFVVRVIR